MAKSEFYRLDEIKKLDADYHILLSERSNGKSFAVKEEAIKLGLETHTVCAAVMRRYDEDIKKAVIENYFDDLGLIKLVKDLSKGEYNCITFYQSKFYFSTMDEESGKITKGFPFCRVFALSQDERYKSSTVLPFIRIIIFEEFTTKGMYLHNEVTRFMNLCSTVIRLNKAKIYMIANKVSRVCPYFNEWALRGIPKMKDGQIDIYNFTTLDGEKVKIAVELCAVGLHKKSGMFFGRQGEQIDGGAWECNEHPHIFGDLSEYDILYYMTLQHMDFAFNILLICHKKLEFLCVFVYPVKVKTFDRVLTEAYSTDPRHTPTLDKTIRPEVIINDLVSKNKLVYPSNLIGEDFITIVKNMKVNPFTLK